MPIQKASHAEQIANELRAAIESGEFKPGDKLPSDSALAKRFDVSKPTASKARTMLVALGIVESRAGAASLVRDTSRDALPANNQLQRARRTGRIYPAGHHARVLRAQLAPASDDVAAGLRVDLGADVIERQRLTYAQDGAPLVASISYFPAALAPSCPGLLETERIKEGTTLYVEQRTGRRAHSVASSIWCAAGWPGAEDALKQLAPDDAGVLVVATTTHDQNDEPLAYEVELHPPGARITLDLVTV